MDDLYQKEILRLAAEAHGAGRLSGPDGTATVDNPFCGDRVTIDLKLDGGRITGIGFEAKACALCQASASVIGHSVTDKSRSDIEQAMHILGAYLKSEGELPAGAWPEFGVFAPVKAHPSRHRCLLLPFEALLLAFDRTHG
jgi:NifU-like protein involved in Fe-S cluster formation